MGLTEKNDFEYKINKVFAEDAPQELVKNILDQPPAGNDATDEMTYATGFTSAYQTEPIKGGRYVEMREVNGLFNQAFGALKEIQEIMGLGHLSVEEASKLMSGNDPFNTSPTRPVYFKDGIPKEITGNISNNTTGNAGSADKLKTARNIGGVSFNGTANINLPGVNQKGNQDTTGNAGSADKLKTARNLKTKLDSSTSVSFDGSRNVENIPVTGILPIGNGGTGSNNLNNFALLNRGTNLFSGGNYNNIVAKSTTLDMTNTNNTGGFILNVTDKNNKVAGQVHFGSSDVNSQGCFYLFDGSLKANNYFGIRLWNKNRSSTQDKQINLIGLPYEKVGDNPQIATWGWVQNYMKKQYDIATMTPLIDWSAMNTAAGRNVRNITVDSPNNIKAYGGDYAFSGYPLGTILLKKGLGYYDYIIVIGCTDDGRIVSSQMHFKENLFTLLSDFNDFVLWSFDGHMWRIAGMARGTTTAEHSTGNVLVCTYQNCGIIEIYGGKY